MLPRSGELEWPLPLAGTASSNLGWPARLQRLQIPRLGVHMSLDDTRSYHIEVLGHFDIP